MSGVLFDFDAARRISRTVREFEQGRNRDEGMENGGLNASNQAWVQTPSSLPGGYDGTDALTGTIVYVLDDGTVYDTTTECFIKDPNDNPLEVSKVYRGTFNGAFEQSGTTLGLHLVQAGGAAASGVTLGYYNGGNVVTGSGSPYTYITLADGSSMRIGGTPWGDDLYAAWHNPDGFGTGYYPGLYQGAWGVILNDTNDRTYNYSIIPFTVVVEAKYYGHFEMVADFVKCRKRYASRSANGNFTAIDPLKLVPTSGWYAVTLLSKKGYVWTTGYGWEVIACRYADLSGSPTIPLIGGTAAAAFPNGMGGAFQATPTSGTSEVS